MIFDSRETRLKVLEEFLKNCVMEGWNDETLKKSVVACGIEEKFLPMIFENGCLDVAEFYLQSNNNKAAENIAKIENFASKKIRDKIRLFLYARFEVENKLVLQRLINFYLNWKNFKDFERGPKPMIQGLRACFKIADFIWSGIGDKSTDFNFYTKRLTLAKIILRSLFVFLKDESSDFLKTKNFIDAEIEKVMKFEKSKARIKKIFGEFFLDEKGEMKSPKEMVSDLPFFRLKR